MAIGSYGLSAHVQYSAHYDCAISDDPIQAIEPGETFPTEMYLPVGTKWRINHISLPKDFGILEKHD